MKNDILKFIEISMVLLVLFALSDAHAESYPSLYSPSGNYMGEISDAPWRDDSISNPIGRYGSSMSPDSIHNTMGRFGSEYSRESPYYIGRPGSLERPENTSRSRRLRRELQRELDWLE